MSRAKLYGQSGGGEVLFNYSNYFGEQQDSVKTVLPNLSLARAYLKGDSIGDYALFAGGIYTTTSTSGVDAYSKALIKTSVTSLSYQRNDIASAKVGNYVLFAGGIYSSGSSTIRTEVDAYDSSLVKTNPTGLSSARYGAGGMGVGDYALIAGGNGGSYLSSVETYNTSLVKSIATSLSTARTSIASAKVGGYALFAGGNTGSLVVDAYDSSLVRIAPTPLSTARSYQTSASVKNYAMFAGGGISSTVIDVYNTSLVRTSANLSVARYCQGCGVGDIAYFAGGTSGTSGSTGMVDAINNSLVRSAAPNLTVGKDYMGCASVGRYALFVGGNPGNTSNLGDAFTPYPEKVNVPVTKGSKYNFGSETQASENILLSLTTPINGYLKYKNGKFDFA